jgi:hypothetical protein
LPFLFLASAAFAAVGASFREMSLQSLLAPCRLVERDFRIAQDHGQSEVTHGVWPKILPHVYVEILKLAA